MSSLTISPNFLEDAPISDICGFVAVFSSRKGQIRERSYPKTSSFLSRGIPSGEIHFSVTSIIPRNFKHKQTHALKGNYAAWDVSEDPFIKD